MLIPTPFREAEGNIDRVGDLAHLISNRGANLQLRDSTGLSSLIQ